MSAQHTPGPWVVGSADWTDAGNARYELRGIKTISAPDARLISAAPELLAALNGLQANPNDPYAHRKALDAIKKAT